MHAFIVSASPRAGSLTEKLASEASAVLIEQGHSVDLLELRAADWNPVVTAEDYGVPAITMPVGDHARAAGASKTLSEEILQQQSRLKRADLVVFAFPLWWASMPAILKGWVDRVFTDGFAYGLRDDVGEPRKYGDGAFVGKRAVIITTAGERESAFGRRGVNGHIDDLLFPINHGIFWYTGMQVLPPVALLGADSPAWFGDARACAEVRRRFSTVFVDAVLPYRFMLEDYDHERVLKSDPEESHGFSMHLSEID